MTFQYASWPLPANVHAGWTTRRSGFSRGVFAHNNVARHVVGDETFELNRNLLQQRMKNQPRIVWLNQTHSTEVVTVHEANPATGQDGSYTTDSDIACCVMTADCLPVFLWSANGAQIAAVHAGWRGLADGILKTALSRFNELGPINAGIGPSISQPYFEVGVDVVNAFAKWPRYDQFFKTMEKTGKFVCDLAGLAKYQLETLGVKNVYLSNQCTFRQVDDYYSYRRDGLTGRMANVIWKT